MVPGFKSLKYPGAHHFEAQIMGPQSELKACIFTNLLINYSRDLHTHVKRRDGSDIGTQKKKGLVTS